MKALLITSKGLEETAALEAKELVKAKSKILDEAVSIEIKNFNDLFKLCYLSQSIKKVVYLLGKFKIKDMKKKIDSIDFSEWINKDTSFKTESRSKEIEEEAGALIKKKIKNKVDLENPDIIFHISIQNNDCYLGIDFSGIDLSKRDYKIFNTHSSIKGTLAYFLLRFSDYRKNHVLLDPFCDSGEIAIEAALYSSEFPVNHYRKDNFAFLRLKPFQKKDFDKFFSDIDKKIKKITKPKIFAFSHLLNNIKSSQKNSKIAGINKSIKFSRLDVEWLDTKFKEKEVDRIITKLFVSQQNDRKKQLNELFYQSKYILKKSGSITILTNHKESILNAAKKQNFKLKKQKSVWAGKAELQALIFKS